VGALSSISPHIGTAMFGHRQAEYGYTLVPNRF